MTFEQEFKTLKPYDPIQSGIITTKGYTFFFTAGHGYLVVPKTDKNAHIAKRICKYGFIGNLAYYLEEDCEAGNFITAIN